MINILPFGSSVCAHIGTICMHTQHVHSYTKFLFVIHLNDTASVHKGPLTVLVSHEDFRGACQTLRALFTVHATEV